MRIFWSQRIHRKEPPDPWIVHSVLIIHRVSFALHLVIHFLTLEPITVIPSTSVPTRHLHTIWIIITIRSEEHTSELQSRPHLVCRLLLEKKKKKIQNKYLINK